MSWSVPPWVYPAWDYLYFLDLGDYFLSQLGQFLAIICLEYFLRFFLSLFSFWDPYNVNAGTCNVVPEGSQTVLGSFFCSAPEQ